MQNLVETTGEFMLVDPGTGNEIAHNRPSVCGATHFVASRVALGQVTVLSNQIPNDLTDKDFAKFWSESNGDKDLAVQSFLASFGPKEEDQEAPKEIEKEAAKEIEKEAPKEVEKEAAKEIEKEKAK